ncbi:hypothetical protein MY10362_007316 [Beauveria mimosiformis]
MAVAAVSSVTLPTTDSPAHLARAVLDSHVMTSAKGVECRDMADWYVFLRRRLRWAGNPVDFGEDAHDRLKKLVEKIPKIEEHGEDVDDPDVWFGPTRCYMKRHEE